MTCKALFSGVARRGIKDARPEVRKRTMERIGLPCKDPYRGSKTAGRDLYRDKVDRIGSYAAYGTTREGSPPYGQARAGSPAGASGRPMPPARGVLLRGIRPSVRPFRPCATSLLRPSSGDYLPS